MAEESCPVKETVDAETLGKARSDWLAAYNKMVEVGGIEAGEEIVIEQESLLAYAGAATAYEGALERLPGGDERIAVFVEAHPAWKELRGKGNELLDELFINIVKEEISGHGAAVERLLTENDRESYAGAILPFGRELALFAALRQKPDDFSTHMDLATRGFTPKEAAEKGDGYWRGRARAALGIKGLLTTAAAGVKNQ